MLICATCHLLVVRHAKCHNVIAYNMSYNNVRVCDMSPKQTSENSAEWITREYYKKVLKYEFNTVKCIFATIHFGICLQYTLFSNNHCSVREDKDYINLLCKFVINVSDCTYAGYFHDLY